MLKRFTSLTFALIVLGLANGLSEQPQPWQLLMIAAVLLCIYYELPEKA